MTDVDGMAPGRVRVLAAGRDGTLTCQVLAAAGIGCAAPSRFEEFARDLESAWVLIVAEEQLTPSRSQALFAHLAGQPPWSDLPIVVVARPGGRAGRVMRSVEALGNVSVLARPLCVDELVTAVRSGLRARRRQFEARDLLRQRDEADRRKDEFLAMLAHELRNPLAPIRSGVGLMKMMDLADPDLVEVREVLDRQVRHMARLVDDLLDVARITSGRIELRARPVDLVEIARHAARAASAAMEARGHEFAVSLPAGPLTIEADPARIEQVLANVLGNAAKYTPPGGRVGLSVGSGPSDAVVRVSDDGDGIAPEVLPRVFDLFAQAEQSLDRAQGGLGIGLTIVRRLVELHGGQVAVRSPGKGLGTEVEVRLPLRPGSSPARVDGGAADGPRARGLRILLVEDSPDSANLLARVLRLQGHEVRVARDGAEAVEAAPAFRPQVVLTDIGLPGLDGYEVARRLRLDPSLGRPLIVAVTGYASPDDVGRSEAAGIDHHLAKPLDLDRLGRLLAAHPCEATA